MLCQLCHRRARRNGTNHSGSHRYRCDNCRRSFTAGGARDRRRLARDTAIICLRLLLEGNSIRSTERLTGVHRDTIMRAMVEAGQRCRAHLDSLRQVPAADVQIDELWAFVAMKERTRERLERGPECGDAWTYLAFERRTKLFVAHHVGKKTPEDALLFMEKLRRAVRPAHIQLSSDGFNSYPPCVSEVFGVHVDYGQIIKTFGNAPETGTAGRYSPGQIASVTKRTVLGSPDEDRICTSHVERQNKTLRMQIRRFTRLTDGHSKKWKNHEVAVALFLANYNYCRVHKTLTTRARMPDGRRRRTTPAMAAGLTDHVWPVGELLATVAVPVTATS